MKAIRKIIALATGATMVGATIMGAMAADLADYPKPFVTDCSFSGAIVVGKMANAEDVAGATDIGTKLAISGTASASSGTAGSIAVSGDSWQVKTSSKVLEIGDPVQNITSYISDGDLNALADGTFSNNKGSFPYEQELRFGPMGVNNYEDDDDNVGDMLYIVDSANFINYTLDFTTTAESDVDTDTSKTLKDFRNKKLSILGREYSIVKATNSSGTELRLMAGAVNDILEQGQTKTYTIDGKDYEVELSYVGTTNAVSKAKFKINGVTTDLLEESDTDTVAGIEVGVKDIMEEEAGEVTADQVEFYLGASKLILKDTNIGDAASSNKLTVGDEEMDDVAVIMTGTATSSLTKLDTIRLVYTADDDYFLHSGEKVSSKMEEPQGLINFDIGYEGLTTEEKDNIEFVGSGDKKYELKFTTAAGDVTLPLTWNGDTDTDLLLLGDNNYNISMVPDKQIKKNQYVILTPATFGATTSSTETQVLQYRGADRKSSSDPKVKFKNLATGETMERTWDYTNAQATIKLGGTDYVFKNLTSDALDDFDLYVNSPNLAISYTNTSAAPQNQTNLGNASVEIVTNYGAVIRVSGNWSGATAPGAPGVYYNVVVNITEVDAAAMIDSGTSGRSFTVLSETSVASTASLIMDFTATSTPTLRQTKDDDDVSIGWTVYGAKVTKTSETSSPDKYVIEWPKVQLSPQVFVTSGEVKATQVGSGAGSVCPVDVPSSKLDTEVSDVNAQNLIVVGGPCANTVAASIMGVAQTFPECAAGFEEGKAKIKLYETSSGNVALIVAGYSAADTRRASKVLKSFKDYALSGDEVEVTGTSMTDISVGKPTVA